MKKKGLFVAFLFVVCASWCTFNGNVTGGRTPATDDNLEALSKPAESSKYTKKIDVVQEVVSEDSFYIYMSCVDFVTCLSFGTDDCSPGTMKYTLKIPK